MPLLRISRVRPASRLGHTLSRTLYTFPDRVQIDPEVRDAVNSNKPVVALESTILTHGIPYPHNLALAHDLNSIIRSEGAVPATIALVKGRPVVGATDAELEYLCSPQPASDEKFIKISRRDIAYAVANGVTGGTTIAGTMILAHLAGIRVFATGGLGGVHRGAEHTLDVSADLEELGRTPVAVVSAGAKAILDLAKTFEYLETKGVHVSTYGEKGVNIPAFYSRDSGIKSPFNWPTPEAAAAVIHANSLLKLQSGMLFCVPPPPEFAIPSEDIDKAIDEAVIAANEAQVKGKDITPFLLDRILQITDGKSLKSNIGFVKNNIRMGAKIAVALANHESGAEDKTLSSPSALSSSPLSSPSPAHPASSSSATTTPPRCLVVGAVAVDLTCDLPYASLASPSSYHHTSNPGAIHRTPGGVGFNVCLAASYSARSSPPSSFRMISAVGPDARDINSALGLSPSSSSRAPDLSGVRVDDSGRTAQYIAMHDQHGGLILACADMSLVENLSPAHIRAEFARAKTEGDSVSWVAVDANLNAEPLTTAVACAAEIGARVMLEPTAVIKAQAVLDLLARGDLHGVYTSSSSSSDTTPRKKIDLMTPNDIELAALFEYARTHDLFDTPSWWTTLDSFATTHAFRTAVAALHTRSSIPDAVKPELEAALVSKQGLVQQAVHLLPYIPHLFIKLGRLGVVSVQLVSSAELVGVVDLAPHALSERLSTAPGVVVWTGDEGRSIVVAHHPPLHVSNNEIVSVTGAGDSFAGVLLSELVDHEASSSSDEQDVLADIGKMQKIVKRAQMASVMTLKSRFAISPEIQSL